MNVLVALASEIDEHIILDSLADQSFAEVKIVRNISEARALFRGWKPEVAFVDPALQLNNGAFYGTRESDQLSVLTDINSVSETGFIKFVQSVNPQVNLIFVCDSFEFSQVALSVRTSGYLVRPLRNAAVLDELKALRYPVSQRVRQSEGKSTGVSDFVGQADEDVATKGYSSEGLFIRAFGNFEAFYNGDPIRFKHGRTKELFAYLVDRYGAMVSNGELISALWEDGNSKRHAPYLRALKLDLTNTLDALGCGDAIVREHGGIACNTSHIKCDYFAYLRSGKNETKQGARSFNYRGEYMSQYGWAKSVNDHLSDLR